MSHRSRPMTATALRIVACLAALAARCPGATEVFTGGINNHHDLCLPGAQGWTTVAAQAGGFYLHPNGWFDAKAGMGIDQTGARAQLLDNFAHRRFIVEDDFAGLWAHVQKGDAGFGLRHISATSRFKLSVQTLRPGWECVGYSPNVGPDRMLEGDPAELARRFAEATRAVREAGIPVYWLWTPVSRPQRCIELREEVPGTGMQRWEYLAVTGGAAGVSFDIPPDHVMQNGGPTKAAIDWWLHEMIPRCRARKLKTIWLCNTIHSSGQVFRDAVERVLAADAMADILVPTDFGAYDYPATPESAAGLPDTATTTGAALWAIGRLRPVGGAPAGKP